MADNQPLIATAPGHAMDAPTPVSDRGRIASLDLLRGFALLGILAMNIIVFAAPFASYMNPTIYFPFSGSDKAVWIFNHFVFDMKMMTLFSILFGAGVVLYSQKAQTKEQTRRIRWLWFRRSLWLLLIGLIHAYLIWVGDILVGYALCALVFLWWARKLPNWALYAVAAFMLTLGVGINAGQGWWMGFFNSSTDREVAEFMYPMSMVEGEPIPDDVQEKITKQRESMAEQMVFFQPTPEQVEEELVVHRGSYLDIAKHRAPFLLLFQVFGFFTFILPRAGAAMLLGIALYRNGFLTAAWSSRAYAITAILCYAIGLPIIYLGYRYNASHVFDAAKIMLVGMHFNFVASVLIAIAHAALVILILVKAQLLAPLARALTAVGRTAFSNYLLQSILCTTVFYGYGLGLFGDLSRLELALFVVLVWAIQLTISPLWLARYRFGPAEWLWRSLTYWKLQPMRRAA